MLVIACGASSLPAEAQTFPGFADEPFAAGLTRPTAMAFAPDGRLFVTEQDGSVRVVKGGVLGSTPFLTLKVDSRGERGLLGIAFHPDFASNRFVYVYHTVPANPPNNRITRFTANGGVAHPGSAKVILNLNSLSGYTYHNGGAIHFGRDGKLYVAVGENANSANAQSLSNRLGKNSAHQRRWLHPRGQPDLLPGNFGQHLRRQPRHLGGGPAQSLHLFYSARNRGDNDQ